MNIICLILIPFNQALSPAKRQAPSDMPDTRGRRQIGYLFLRLFVIFYLSGGVIA
jgi:hypothetical protein